MPNFLVTAPDGSKYSITAPEGMSQDDVLSRAKSQLGYNSSTPQTDNGLPDFQAEVDRLNALPVSRSGWNSFKAGVSRTGSELGNLATNVAPSMVGSVLGADTYAKKKMADAKEAEENLQRANPAQFAEHGIGSAGDIPAYLGEKLGEAAPYFLPSIVTGGVGSIVGGSLARGAAAEALEGAAARRLAAGAARKAATGEAEAATGEAAATFTPEEIHAKAMSMAKTFAKGSIDSGEYLGSVLGAGAADTAINATTYFQDIYNKTGELAPTVALAGGAFAGALGAVLPATIIKDFKSNPLLQKEVIERIATEKGATPSIANAIAWGSLKGASKDAAIKSSMEVAV